MPVIKIVAPEHEATSSAFLEGRKVYLRSLSPSDAEGSYPNWFNDPEACAGNSHHIFPYTKESALEHIQFAAKTRESLILAIVRKADHRHIGNIALQRIHPVNHSAEFSIFIGDKNAWGQGIGKEASQLVFDHGFFTMNLHRIACGVFSSHPVIHKMLLGLGMKVEGRLRKAVFKNGKYVDVVQFGVLRKEYRQHREP